MQINKVNLTVTAETSVGFDVHSEEESSFTIQTEHGHVEIFGSGKELFSFAEKLNAAVELHKRLKTD